MRTARPLTQANRASSQDRRWLQAAWQQESTGDLHERAVRIVEQMLAREAVRLTQGNRTAAARRLGLDRATLRNRLGGE